MKTGLDIVDDLWTLLDAASLPVPVYKYQKPDNITPDAIPDFIVVKPLANDGEQLQKGVVLVNVHARNIQGTVSGLPGSLPNSIRLKQLQALVLPVVADVMINDLATKIQNFLLVPDKDETFLSIRIFVYIINI